MADDGRQFKRIIGKIKDLRNEEKSGLILFLGKMEFDIHRKTCAYLHEHPIPEALKEADPRYRDPMYAYERMREIIGRAVYYRLLTKWEKELESKEEAE